MLSRVANSIYWMTRYIERAENVARFIDVNLNLTLEANTVGTTQWEPLIAITGDTEFYLEKHEAFSKDAVMHFLTFDESNPSSILSCISAARENARSIREIISSEMWEELNRFFLVLKDAAGKNNWKSNPNAFYHDVKSRSHLFEGVMDATMSHNEGWQFGRLGRLLERADKTSRILDVKYFLLLPKVTDVGTPIDTIQWMAVLRSASAFEMFRKVWRRFSPLNVAEFLIFDKVFPRSIYYGISHAEIALHRITDTPMTRYNLDVEKNIFKLRSQMEWEKIDDIIKSGLHEYLDGLQIAINKIGDSIFETFFAVRPVDHID